MKIHTTQDLTSIRDISITNNSMPREVRYNYLERSRMHSLFKEPELHENYISFKGKKQVVDRAADIARKTARKENKFVKWISNKFDKISERGFFNSILDLMNHEVFIQSAISCLVCVVARPITIMGMAAFSDENNTDFKYAAGHSVSSGLVGLVGSLAIATPFSKGTKHLMKNYIHELDPRILKEAFPNLNIDSIWKDAAKTERKPIGEWLDTQGNIFSREFKNSMKVARPKYIEDVSEGTLKSLGADVDLAAMKGKSVNDWVDRNGKKLHFDLKEMFIQVKDEGMNAKDQFNFFSLKHIDENYLKEVFPELDIKSITKNGERLHTDNWKNVDGTPFKLDMNKVMLSSYRETKSATPLYTGRTRIEAKGTGSETTKFVAYQSNNGVKNQVGVPDKLGSEIKQEWLDADNSNAITQKLLTWMPDIVTRPLVAGATIEILPIVLKKVFGLEKHKKQEEPAKEVNINEVTQPKEEVASGKAVA